MPICTLLDVSSFSTKIKGHSARQVVKRVAPLKPAPNENTSWREFKHLLLATLEEFESAKSFIGLYGNSKRSLSFDFISSALSLTLVRSQMVWILVNYCSHLARPWVNRD